MQPIYRGQHGLLWLIMFLLVTGCAPMAAVGVGAGVGSGALVAEDRRTSGIFIEDESIELKSAKRIHEQLGSQVHINVTSFNRIVLLTGEAPTGAIKDEISKLVRSVENVRNVINEITIGEKSSFGSRSNDTFITSKVKSRFLASGEFQINHIKIVTEQGVVYLLGVVKRKEAENATQIASATSGVSKVVKVFEYLD